MLDYRKREREDASRAATSRPGGSDHIQSTPPPSSRPLPCDGFLQSATTSVSPQTSQGSLSSRAQRAGFQSLQDLRRELSASSVSTTGTSNGEASQGRSTLASVSIQEESEEARDARLAAEDAAAVDGELKRYLEEELSSQDIDLLAYWDVRRQSTHILEFLC